MVTTTPSTTIKVPSALRDRLNEQARSEGVTVAQVIERLLREAERAERFRAMRAAWNGQSPAELDEYMAEFAVWNDASRRALERHEPPYG
jgi:macrodomain Ter protein organizer (MatP/YcbG family)